MGWDFLQAVLPVLPVAILLSAGIEDVRTRLIADWKSIAIAASAPIWWLANGLPLWPEVAVQIGIAGMVFALFVAAFHFGWMGGGDVKLIGALALWLPFGSLVTMLVWMSVLGGLVTALSVAHAAMRRRRLAGPAGAVPVAAIEVPYGVAIALAGTIVLGEPLFNQFS